MFASSDWNVDLIPKFLMANGRLVQLLIHTGSCEWPVLMMTLNTFYFLYNAFTLSFASIIHQNFTQKPKPDGELVQTLSLNTIALRRK